MATSLRLADRIDSEARKLRFGRVLLVVISAPFYLIGRLFGTIWLFVAWILTAIRVGWQDARR
jgi:hypothetical protein